MAVRATYLIASTFTWVSALGCGGSAHSSVGVGGTSSGSGSSDSEVNGGAPQGGVNAAAGASAVGDGGNVGLAGTGGAAGAASGGGQAGAPACHFDSPQCPALHAACAQLGATQDCFEWSVCQSAPSRRVCCGNGWEPGPSCAGGGGAGGGGAGGGGAGGGGAGGDGGTAGEAALSFCKACNERSSNICILQEGGPGPASFQCGIKAQCGAADVCSCVPYQGTCQPHTPSSTGYCTCDNGLR